MKDPIKLAQLQKMLQRECDTWRAMIDAQYDWTVRGIDGAEERYQNARQEWQKAKNALIVDNRD
jgi:hypothetical protein